MPLTWNEIKTRAAAFVHEWRDESYEKGEAQTFWNQFLNVFGVSRRRVASFEQGVKKLSGRQGFIDLLWPGVLLVEHKSRGEDLGAAEGQALDYFPGLADEELPRYVLVSDFARMRLHDLETDEAAEFAVADLLDHVSAFGFIAGYERRSYEEQDPVNVEAARKMAALHDALAEAGYRGHDLERMLVRLLFCLFADDTGIFTPRGAFEDFLRERTRPDGSDLGPMLGLLFQTLDTAPDDRQTNLDEGLAAFPYVNGALFAGALRTASFDSGMRGRLLEACALDWGGISPAIFGSLFQGVMDPEERRELGAHYTSETNILKLIGPLFLDGLREELRRAGTNRRALARFHDQLAAFRLLDPACGCGNFLVVAYRELRRLEIETIRALYADDLRKGLRVLDVADLIRVNVAQCFGIEIEDFPAEIARAALWLVDHQMNLEVADAFGEYFTRLPLTATPHVLHGNALTTDWSSAWDGQISNPATQQPSNPATQQPSYTCIRRPPRQPAVRGETVSVEAAEGRSTGGAPRNQGGGRARFRCRLVRKGSAVHGRSPSDTDSVRSDELDQPGRAGRGPVERTDGRIPVPDSLRAQDVSVDERREQQSGGSRGGRGVWTTRGDSEAAI